MSVRTADSGDFLLLAYSVPDRDTVVIRGMDRDKWATAVAAKELQGKTKTTTYFALAFGFIPIPFRLTSVLIDDSPEALVRYVQKHGADCLDKTPELMLRREK